MMPPRPDGLPSDEEIALIIGIVVKAVDSGCTAVTLGTGEVGFFAVADQEGASVIARAYLRPGRNEAFAIETATLQVGNVALCAQRERTATRSEVEELKSNGSSIGGQDKVFYIQTKARR